MMNGLESSRRSKRSGFSILRVLLALIAIVIVILLVCTGLVGPIFTLLFGWIGFLDRVLPQARFNMSLAIQAVIATLLIVVIAHSILQWLRAQARNETDETDRPAWQLRWTLAGLAVVMLMFVAGISMTGAVHQVYWLASSEEPLMGGSMSIARRASSINKLKQIGLAVLNFHDRFRRLPAGGTFNEYGEMQHGWITPLLPDMEQGQLTVDTNVPWDHPNNRETFETVIPELLNPSLGNRPETNTDGYALSHYAANSRVMGGREPLTLKQVTDGTSHTLLAGEVNHDFMPWGHPRNWRDPVKGIHRERGGFGSIPQQHGAVFVFVDGSVHLIDEDIDPEVLRALATPAGNDHHPGFDDID